MLNNRPFVMRDRVLAPSTERKPPRCDSCRGERTAHVAGTLWKCIDCGHQFVGREYLRGDPEYWRIVEQRQTPQEEKAMPTGVYDRSKMKKPDHAAVKRLVEMRRQQSAQAPGMVAVTLEIVDEIPPDPRGRIGNGGRWMELRKLLRTMRIPAGKAARISADTNDKRDGHRMAATARAIARERGARWTIGIRREGLRTALYIADADQPAEKA